MPPLLLSLCIGIVAAVVLTSIRGGWHDSPYVVPVFGVSGFLISYGIIRLVSLTNLERFERMLSGYRAAPFVRTFAAITAALSGLFWSGQLIQGAGFGGWLVALFLGIVFPLVVCLLTAHQPIGVGCLAATCMVISTLANHPNFSQDMFNSAAWKHFWENDIGLWLVILSIQLCLSLVVSIPLSVQRHRLTTHSGD